MEAVYTVEHLTKVYRDGAVIANDDVSFSLQRGTAVAVFSLVALYLATQRLDWRRR